MRAEGRWRSVADLARRADLDRGDLQALAGADALSVLVGSRHLAAWEVAGIPAPLPLVPDAAGGRPPPSLPIPGEGQSIVSDYASLGLTLRRHPLALLRGHLVRRRLLSAREIDAVPAGRLVSTAGLVVNRQRPASANSVTFVTLEDETGHVNLVVWKRVAERQRKVLLGARLLGVMGEIQRESGVTHLVARRLRDYSDLLGGLVFRSRDFR
jgi:error-prone DNA polymerase